MTTPPLDQLFDRQVIVTPIDPLNPPPNGAIVCWHDKEQQGVVIQPLHTAEDRAWLARRIEQIRQERNTS